MGRGSMGFAVAFVLVPVLLLLGAILSPGYAVGLAFAGVSLLLVGFTLGLGLLDE